MESEQMALSCSDDFIASIIINASENPTNTNSLMSDDDFAHELQMQEVIISSLINLQPSHKTLKKIKIEPGESSKMGASSSSSSSDSASHSLCEICAERKPTNDMFPLPNCSHTYCKSCISRHVTVKIETRAVVKQAAMACPGVGCGGSLDDAACREVVPGDVVRKWDEVLCEAAIAAAERVYCPYKDCSALLVNDCGGGGIREAECPFCRRLFCAMCKVPWHSGMDCDEFSKLGKDEREREDLLVHDLAKRKNWKRCDKCKFFVEKNQGCLHITCRCGYQFCYACGKAWSSTHGNCQ